MGPNCFHHSAAAYGVAPPRKNSADAPSSDGVVWYCAIQCGVEGPTPPCPAQPSQFCQPVISSIFEKTLAVEGTPPVPPLLPTLTLIGVLKIPPPLSQACTTTEWSPVYMLTEALSESALTS